MHYMSRVALAVLALICVGALAACGGSSSSSSSSTAAAGGSSEGTASGESSGETETAASKSELSGEPVKLMVAGHFHSADFTTPYLADGAIVAAEELNAEGGIDGRPVEIVKCNGENDPNTMAKCMRTAVEEEVVALVAGINLFGEQTLPILESAGIPWLGAEIVAQFNSPVYWLAGGDPASGFLTLAQGLVEGGCKTPGALLENFAAAKEAEGLWALGVAAAGAEYGGGTVAAENTPDWAPSVASVVEKGQECAGLMMQDPSASKVVRAVEQSPTKIQLAAPGATLDTEDMEKLGSSAEGVEVFKYSAYPPYNTPGYPKLTELGEKIMANDPEAVLDQHGTNGYNMTMVVAQAAKQLAPGEELTAESLAKAMPKVVNFNTEMGAILSFNKENPDPTFSRIFNQKEYLTKWDYQKEEFVLAAPKPVEVPFAAAAKITEEAEG